MLSDASAAQREREASQISKGWKDVAMKIFGTDERIVLPVMISSKVGDVKKLLAEMHGGCSPYELDFLYKAGPSYRRHRNGDEINSQILVKGIKSFAKGDFTWPHPHIVIGAGHMGLRQGLHFQRKEVPWVLFDRKERVGGNAWIGIGNVTSKLQTEGPQYQLQYDLLDKNVHGLMEVGEYGYWPSREEICAHLAATCDEYGLTPNIRLSTELVDMEINESPDSDIRKRFYDFTWQTTTGPQEEGHMKFSCQTYYPGCLVVPHRNTWPGEDTFDGHIGYGFSHEFDYKRVDGQDAILIGMGAFAHENVRTFVEHGGRKCYNIARHFNLMMPRMVCWWINQSCCPPTAAMVLNAMEPVYSIVGLSPWNFFSVTANADRSVATIRQYTRWGISDIYMLSMYFGKLETINGEVKRFKPRAAVLNTGRVIEDLDHVIKVIGFDGDFGVDKLMKCKVNLGPWPDGDWRRFVMSDQSAIDASRFTNIAISPAVSSMSFMALFYFTHPELGPRALETGNLPENPSEPELGSPCYHYAPRKGTAMMMVVGGIAPEMAKFDEWNQKMKKGSMHHIASAECYQTACERDWFKYCKLFRDQGCTHKWPAYPITCQGAKRLCEMEAELQGQEELKWMVRMGVSPEAARAHREAQEAAANAAQTSEQLEEACEQPGGAQQPVEPQPPPEEEFALRPFMPGDPESFEPARRVIQARQRSPGPAKDKGELDSWLREGHEVKDFLIRATSSRSPSPQRLGR